MPRLALLALLLLGRSRLATCRLSFKKPLVWGLDLGNDDCVAAIAGRDGVEAVMNDISERQTPTAVYFNGNMRLLGEYTSSVSGSAPANLVNNVKLLIANSKEIPLNYAVREEESGERKAVVSHMNEKVELEPCELVGMVLAHVNRIVETSGQGRSSSFVCGVPSYFTRKQRATILDGALIQRSEEHPHGLPLHGIVDEGVAIALSYGMLKRGVAGSAAAEQSASTLPSSASTSLSSSSPPSLLSPPSSSSSSSSSSSVVAFVDIGHSCTQVTVASFNDGQGLAVLGRGCTQGCGVSSLQGRVFDHVVDGVVKKKGVAVRGAARPTHRLMMAVAKLIKTLSANAQAQLSVECIDGDVDIQCSLSREELEGLTVDVAKRVEKTCSDALLAAGLEPAQVSCVELLGGGSYVPMFQRAVERVFGAERVCRTINSSESVAKGCALAAAQLSTLFRSRPFQITDKLPASLALDMKYELLNKKADSQGADRLGDVVVTKGSTSWAAGTTIPFQDKIVIPIDPSRLKVTSGSGDAKDDDDDGGGGGGYDGEWVVEVHLVDQVSGDKVSSYTCTGTAGLGKAARQFMAKNDGARCVDAQIIVDLAMDISGEAVIGSACLEIEIEAKHASSPSSSSSSSSSSASSSSASSASSSSAPPLPSVPPLSSPSQLPSSPSSSPSPTSNSSATTLTEEGASGGAMHVHMFTEALSVNKTYSMVIQGQRLEDALKKEARLAEADKTARDASEARNALEDQIYAVRGQLTLPSEGGSGLGLGELARFVTPAEAEAILAMLTELEDWIYSSSSADNTLKGKQAYLMRSVQLQSKLRAPLERKRSFQSVHNALDDLDQALLIREKEYRDCQDAMSKTDIRRCDKELASLQHWLAEMRNSLEAMESSVDTKNSSGGGGGGGPVYGSLAGKLPCTPQQAQKRLEQLIDLAKSLDKYRRGGGGSSSNESSSRDGNVTT